MKTNWDKRFMELADHISKWSKDNRSFVGAVLVKDNLVISTGYNGFYRGAEDLKEQYEDADTKEAMNLHAEENVILNAARLGIPTVGTTMYLNWFPCERCARTIVQAGIKRLVCGKKPDLNHPKYGQRFVQAMDTLRGGDIDLDYELLPEKIYKIDVGNIEGDIENYINEKFKEFIKGEKMWV